MNPKMWKMLFSGIAPTSSMICSEGDDGAAGGGGNGGDGGDGGKPPALDDETKKFIANTINASVASHMKRDGFKQMIGETVASSVGDAVKQALAERGGSGDGDGDNGKGKGSGDKPDPRDAEIARLNSEQEALRKKWEKAESDREAEKTKSRTTEERSQLSAALRAAGVDDARLPAAVAFMYLDAKLVKRDENDRICLRFERDWGEELLPIEKGAVEYLKTDAGKVFLPPVDAAGSGNPGGRPPRSKPGEKPTRAELLTHLGNQMLHGGTVPGGGR